MFEERDTIFEEENQKRLIEQIQNAPDCEIYGINNFNQRSIKQALILTVFVSGLFFIVGLLIYHTIISIIVFVLDIIVTMILLAVLTYLNYSHNYFKTYISMLGIAKNSIWDTGAIPWDKIEYIETKNKGDDIDYIIFRSGSMKIGYRNSHFVTRLSLEIVSEYIGGLDNWFVFDDLKETTETTESDRFYMQPDIDKSEGRKKLEDILLMEWLGEQDFDADKTQEHLSYKSDDELYVLIMEDPRCECLYDAGRFARIIGNFKVTFAMLFVAIAASIAGMFIEPYSVVIYSGVVILFILMFYSMFKSDEKLVLSPIGVARYIFGSPEALEWQHVEYFDLSFEEDILVQLEFFGNKRRIFIPEQRYKGKLSLELVRKYLPDIDEWNKTTRKSWGYGTYRLVRPDE